MGCGLVHVTASCVELAYVKACESRLGMGVINQNTHHADTLRAITHTHAQFL